MNDPEEALRAYIEAQYSLADEGVTSEDVAFQTVDYNLDRTVQCPHVIVQLAGWQRIQPGESSLYEFTFLVQVSVFPHFRKSQAGVAEQKSPYWGMVNHLKALFDSFDVDSISGWQYAYVDSGANAGITAGTIPDEYLLNLTVKACIAWSA